MRKKIILFFLCIGLAYFNLVAAPVSKAYSVANIPGLVPDSISMLFNGESVFGDIVREIKKYSDQIIWAIAKAAAIMGSQMAVSAILDPGDGKAPFVTNWDQYLYLSPQQRTMTYMNSLFTQSTRGIESSLNYEGIGQKNVQYLKRQYANTINGRPITYNLRDYGNPDNVFDGNNFRAFNAFFLPQNNPYGIAMIAQNQYAIENEKQKTLADKKQNNGFISKEKNGRIVSPAALLQTGFLTLDKFGTDTITNAQEGSWKDIAIGVSARLVGAGMQSAFGDKAAQEGARQQNATASKTANNIINKQLQLIKQ